MSQDEKTDVVFLPNIPMGKSMWTFQSVVDELRSKVRDAVGISSVYLDTEFVDRERLRRRMKELISKPVKEGGDDA